MKRILFLALSGLLVLAGKSSAGCCSGGSCGDGGCSCAMSQSAPQQLASVESNDAALKTEKIEVGNKICPVEGGEIGSMGEGAKVEYNGKIYNLCCEGCLKTFEGDPEKYSRIAEESLKKK